MWAKTLSFRLPARPPLLLYPEAAKQRFARSREPPFKENRRDKKGMRPGSGFWFEALGF